MSLTTKSCPCRDKYHAIMFVASRTVKTEGIVICSPKLNLLQAKKRRNFSTVQIIAERFSSSVEYFVNTLVAFFGLRFSFNMGRIRCWKRWYIGFILLSDRGISIWIPFGNLSQGIKSLRLGLTSFNKVWLPFLVKSVNSVQSQQRKGYNLAINRAYFRKFLSFVRLAKLSSFGVIQVYWTSSLKIQLKMPRNMPRFCKHVKNTTF